MIFSDCRDPIFKSKDLNLVPNTPLKNWIIIWIYDIHFWTKDKKQTKDNFINKKQRFNVGLQTH